MPRMPSAVVSQTASVPPSHGTSDSTSSFQARRLSSRFEAYFQSISYFSKFRSAAVPVISTRSGLPATRPCEPG